ncbi:hypothetical protein CF15_07545 [Pyrodictium occultum]|uniref:DUF432 domain-containing protein n=1 Tax=Pyrodictium occultum TaxID=2309 RepID=A0A0V8RWY1_PYROC|nr:DUF432 domain-containing protein [Pyrodictium occultum]KSW12559.1 hypothetical protein CF15_07545 [Pyrodictium occultum]
MFGRITLGSHKVCGFEVSLEEYEGKCRYRRDGVKAIVPCTSTHLYPAAPVFYPEYLASYIMVRLEEPVVVESGGGEEFWLSLEYDIVAVVGSQGAGYELVDAMPSKGIGKYALYGPPSRGILARFIPARPLPRQQREDCSAMVRVVARSKSSRPARVSRIVFPASALSLYYDGEGAVVGSNIEVTVTSPFTAIVSLREPERLEGFREAPRLLQRSGVGSQARWSQSFVMSYGI